jgi:hypothetical protein
MTCAEFTSRGGTFVRDEKASVVSMRGPKSVCEEAAAEIAARAERFTAGSLVAVSAKRWGECMTCGDPLPPHVGGQCDFCHAAMRKARRAA